MRSDDVVDPHHVDGHATGQNHATMSTSVPKGALFAVLFGLGLLGILSLLVQPLPMLAGVDLPFDESTMRLLVLIQPTILLAVAVWVGINTAPHVGLHAPLIEALIRRQDAGAILRAQMAPALVVGVVAALLLALFGWYQLRTVPDVVESAGSLPLITRLLYGGITEELLLRWGLLSLFVWLGWRFVLKRERRPTAGVVWGSIVLAALLFGVGHLPVAFLVGLHGPLWITIIIGTNALLGLLYGWLYWRRGLEAAIIAHALTHLLALWVWAPLLSLMD